MTASRCTLLVASGLRPSEGGIQVVGYLSHQAVCQGGPSPLIVFGTAEEEALRLASPCVVRADKWGLLQECLRHRWIADRAVFTHVELLKLLPLLWPGPKEVVLFLMGIEVWRPFGWLTRKMLDRVDHFLSISQHTWNRFVEMHPRFARRRHTVLPLGIGHPLGREPAPPEDPPTTLILSRLAKEEDYKGHRELITVWPRVRQVVPGARLWVAGDGTLRPELEALAQSLGLTDSVRFWGRVSEEQKADLLRRCRCFAMPSRGEGFGLVYLEAMRQGRPCLSGNGDAGREVVGPPEAGLAVNPADTNELVEALGQLLTDSRRWRQWSADAQARYERFFTAEHYQQRFLAALSGAGSQREVS